MNENFFEKINTEEKAYILGFLYADGYFKVGKSGKVGIRLSIKDILFLEKLSYILTGENRVRIHKADPENQPKIKGREIKSGDCVILEIYRKKMAQDLKNTGNESPKSLTLTFPKGLPKYLYSHFIRGYFDGDGCLCIKNNSKNNVKRTEWSMLSSLSFCKSIQNIIKSTLNIEARIKTKGNVYQLEITGNRQCKLILDWIYNNSSIRLTRKYFKYLKFNNLIKKCIARYEKSSSKYNNIGFDKSRNKWVASVRVNNKKSQRIGRFGSEQEAYEAQQKYILSNEITWPQNSHHLKKLPTLLE